MARIGFSGWTFPDWRKNFYPEGLAAKAELGYASSQVNSIEINGTFYALQKPKSFQSWYRQVPDDFQFSVKAPQFITHVLRLKEAEEAAANFFASGLLCLGEKLGAILWQFPPFVTLKDDRFEKFIKLLPRTSRAAAQLATRHGDKVKGRAWTRALSAHPVRHAFEFRHRSFRNPDFLAMLKEYNVAAVQTVDSKVSAGITDLTADFAYVRWLGEGRRFSKGYSAKDLRVWTVQIQDWEKRGIEVLGYFGTEAKRFAPFDALRLSEQLQRRPTGKSKRAA